ncbi:MAG: fibronectin type III domain-containing protein, partial [Candidatus Cryptobacteroides sp.]
MKNVFKYMIAGVVVPFAIMSCQKSEVLEPCVNGLTFTSEKPILEDDTKTAWTGTGIQWSKGDAIRVAYTCDGVWQNADGTATADESSGSKTAKAYQSTSLSADAEIAQFSVPGNFTGTSEGVYVFYGAYPASACTDGADFKYAPSLTVTIPDTQTPAVNSFDSAADFMLGTSVNTYTGIPTEAVSMSWDRMVAHAQLTFKTLNGFTTGETISKVELTADSEADMVGRHYIYLDTKNVNKFDSTVANTLTINGTNLSVDDETGTFVAWASFLPCTIKSLTVVVTTDKATYTREISSCELEFKKNARNTLAIKMDDAIRAELAPQPDYSGEWLIAGINETNYYAAQKWVSGNNLKGLSIVYDGSSVTRVEGIDACKMVFTKVETGTYAGMYTIEDASSTESARSYLYAAASGNNYLKVQTSLDAHSYWTITSNDDGSYRIIAEKSTNRNLMRFNYNNSGSPLFSCYEDKTSATGTDVLLIPYSAVAEDTRTPLSTPEVIADLNSTTPNAIDVMWDAVENAGSYVVTATPTTGTAVSNTVTADGNTTYTYTITGLAYETEYTISVVAKPSDTSLYLDSETGVACNTVKTETNPSSGGTSWVRVTTVEELMAGGTFIIGYEATANSGQIIPMANTGSATTSAAGFIYSGLTAESGGKDTIDMSTVSETSKYEVTIVASTSVSGAVCI